MNVIDPALLQAYLETDYIVFLPKLTINIGAKHPTLDEFLIDNNTYTWAFISAWNPYSQRRTAAENAKEHARLIQFLKKEQLIFAEGEGRSKDTKWLPEKSLLILDISKETAVVIAQNFSQNALVFGAINQVAELVITKS